MRELEGVSTVPWGGVVEDETSTVIVTKKIIEVVYMFSIATRASDYKFGGFKTTQMRSLSFL